MSGPGPAVDTGDAAFEKRFVTHATDPAQARALLTPPLRALILAFPRKLTLNATWDSIYLTWGGGQETDVTVLDAACRIVSRR